MSDTIAAVSTPRQPSAIGIIRISGPKAAAAAGAVFRPRSGGKLEEKEPRKLIYGTLLDRDGQPIDQVLATWTPGPNSATGEETAELQCHGSPAVLAMGLEALFAAGARQAEPGEFTRRAFLNGKMDLAQAEAVIDLIEADTGEAARNAYGQLNGVLSRRIEEIYSGLTDVTAHFHVVLDYPDEDLAPFTTEELTEQIRKGLDGTRALLKTYERGSMLTEGIPCAIVGRTNVGKSSLLNALLGYERAIVTPVPGTTRDTVEERLRLGGVLLRLVDTAGLRASDDPVERLGIQRSRAALEGADLVLAVLDGSEPLTGEDRELLENAGREAACICVINKSDLPQVLDPAELAKDHTVCVVSAATGEGLDDLEKAVSDLFPAGQDEAGSLLTNERQAEAAGRAAEHLQNALDAVRNGVTPDAVLTDVEEAMDCLGQLTGRSVREDITDRIFSRFCVGK